MKPNKGIERNLLSHQKTKDWRQKKKIAIEGSQIYNMLVEKQLTDTLEIEVNKEALKLKLDRKSLERMGIHERVVTRIEGDLGTLTRQLENEKIPLPAYIEEYSQRTNPKYWPKVFIHVIEENYFDSVAEELRSKGIIFPENRFAKGENPEDAFRPFGLLLVQVPPEQRVLPILAGIDRVEYIYDAEAQVNLPDPILPEEDVSPTLTDSIPIIFPPDDPLPPNFPERLGEGIKVAILDTGIDSSHPDLAGKVEEEFSFVDAEGTEDIHGHGTHVAGIIAGTGKASSGKYQGVAPHARLYNAKVLGVNGGSTESVLAGIRWSMDRQVDIINMSLGGPGLTNGKSLLSLAVNRAVEEGKIVVAVAAGNEGPLTGTISIPADAREASTTGASTKEGQIAGFSSRGPTSDPSETGQKPNFVAPGVDIVSTRSCKSNRLPYPNENYTVMSGTSMSAPHVAGAAAILCQYNRILGNNQNEPRLIREAIERGSRPLSGHSPDDQGNGLIHIPDSAKFLYEKMKGKGEGKEHPKESLDKGKEQEIVLGRSNEDVKTMGMNGLAFIGTTEKGSRVLVDILYPHVVFVCGKRGSGKSYTLGVFAEELARQNLGIGIVAVDPIGIFWSFKEANDQRKEVESLQKLGLKPAGMANTRVLVPFGMYKTMSEGADGPFSIAVSDLNVDDWCYLFDLNRFGPQGLLIDRTIQFIRNGYTAIIKKNETEVPPRERYDLNDLINCIAKSEELASVEEGFTLSTRRSIIARLRACQNWGIFTLEGTPLAEISRPNKVTVLDVGHPQFSETLLTLVTGMMSRKIFQARMKISRMGDIAGSTDEDDYIPVTWLIVDEAHILIPKGQKTVATESLVLYARQGRRPGCALIIATQQPGATCEEVIAQTDVIISHSLSFADDIRTLMTYVPARVPFDLRELDFIRGLSRGKGLIADQIAQRDAFVVKVRPRITKHAGKAVTPHKAAKAKKVGKRGKKGGKTKGIPAADSELVPVVHRDDDGTVLELLRDEKRCLSLDEIRDRTGLSREKVRDAVHALEGEGSIGRLRHRRKILFHHADYGFFPEYNMTAPVLTARQVLRKDKASKKIERLMEGGLWNKKEIMKDLQIRYTPLWRFWTEGIKDNLLNKALGWFSGEDKDYMEYVYMDAISENLVVLSHGRLVWTDVPPGAPFEFEDLDQIAEFEERVPNTLEISYQTLSEIKEDKEVRKTFLTMFPETTIRATRVCFLPIWIATLEHKEDRSERLVAVDGIIGGEVEGVVLRP